MYMHCLGYTLIILLTYLFTMNEKVQCIRFKVCFMELS